MKVHLRKMELIIGVSSVSSEIEVGTGSTMTSSGVLVAI